VPDELVLELLGERLRQPDAVRGFLLDGYPRTLAQARTLEGLTPVDVVVSFEVDPKEIVRRLSGRRFCPECGSVYNLESRPPRTRGRCDRDGVELQQRPDDRPEAVEVRLKVYAEQTAPLIQHYRARGLLRPLDASGEPSAVAGRLRQLLGVGRPSPAATRDGRSERL
jgi:adenylate kinase